MASPRDSAKSTFCSFLDIMYAICEGLESYILLIADTNQQAIKYLNGIKHELQTNDYLQAVYPQACGVGDTWSDSGIVTRNHIRIEPLGTGQKIRGRRERQNRPSLIVVDDPQGDEAAYSPTTREHDWDWFTKGVLKAGAPTTNFIVPGTIIHNDCIVGKCMQLSGWEKKTFKAIEEWPTHMDKWGEWENILCDLGNPQNEVEATAYYEQNKDMLHEGARVLWKERENLLALMVMRAEGHNSFESEKQNNPIDPSKCEWPPEYWSGDIWFDQWPTDCRIKTMALDPSKGGTDKPGDYSAIVKIAKSGPLLYIEADMQRRDTTKMVTDFLNHVATFNPTGAAVETNQFQNLIALEIQRQAAIMNLMCPLMPVENMTNKIVRIRTISPYVNMRGLRFKRRSPGTNILLKQLQEFPNSDHDDGPDALEVAIRMMSMLLGAERRNTMMSEAPAGYLPSV